MLGSTVVELKSTHGDDGSTTSVDVHLQQHHLDPEPTAPAPFMFYKSRLATPPLSSTAPASNLKVYKSPVTPWLSPLLLCCGGGAETNVKPDQKQEGTQEKHRRLGDDWVKEMRGWLMVLASLFASMAFQAGLNPPGGLWEDYAESPSPVGSPISALVGHQPDHPILQDLKDGGKRFQAFFWLNSLAFAYSMSMVMLLLSESIFYSKHGLLTLRTLMIFNILILSAVYATGCGRNATQTSVPIVLLLGALLVVGFNIWKAKQELADGDRSISSNSMKPKASPSSSALDTASKPTWGGELDAA